MFVILVQQQVQGRLAESHVVRRLIIASKRGRVQPKWMIRVPHVTLHKHQPRLDQILLGHEPVEPALVRRPRGETRPYELDIDYWPR